MDTSNTKKPENLGDPALATGLKADDIQDWEDPDWEDDLNPAETGEPESELEAQIRRCKQLENKLRSLQITYELNKKNTAKLIKDNQTVLKDRIHEYKKTIAEQEALIRKCKKALRSRNERLTFLEGRIDELEEALSTPEDVPIAIAKKPAEKKSEQPAEPQTDTSEEKIKEVRSEFEAKISEFEAKIEALSQQKMALHRTGEYYRSLFTSAAEAMLIIDPQSRRIIQSNQLAADLFGEKSPEELNDQIIDALAPKRQPDNTISQVVFKASLHKALDEGKNVFEHQFMAKNEQLFNVIISMGIISHSPADDMIVIIHDITDLQKKLSEPSEELNEAQHELEVVKEVNHKQSDIFRQVADAVQTSLAPVLTTARELAEEQHDLSDTRWQQLDEISSNSRYLIGMINYLSVTTSIADGSVELDHRGFDLHKLINKLDQFYGQKAEAKKLFFATSFAQQKSEHQIPKEIVSDREKIEFILRTLLTYAMRNTDKGRLGLHARREENPDENENLDVVFEIAYTGKSETDDRLTNVFNSKNEANAAFDPELDFDLALTLQYARLLGGDIKLEFRHGGITSLSFNTICQSTGTEPKPEAQPTPPEKEVIDEEASA